MTIAVIPEGFTEDEMSTYEMLAKSGIDALMNTEPFRSYKEYFNVWIMRVASQESGASVTDGNGNVTTAVNSYFGAKWGKDSYSDMVADENLVYSYVTEHCPDIINGKHTIQEVPILMIINDKRYGGICHSYSDGRAYCMVPYTYEGGAMTWSFPSIMPKSDEPFQEEHHSRITMCKLRKPLWMKLEVRILEIGVTPWCTNSADIVSVVSVMSIGRIRDL